MYWPLPFPDEGPFPNRPARMRELDPDERLTTAVAARLLLDDRTRTVPITAQAQHRVVILTGVVPTAQIRRIAGEIAATTDGVRDVCNTLRVARRRPGVKLLAGLIIAAYISLFAGLAGASVGLIVLALGCALLASVLETRPSWRVRRPRR
jgi:hypothetical protein